MTHAWTTSMQTQLLTRLTSLRGACPRVLLTARVHALVHWESTTGRRRLTAAPLSLPLAVDELSIALASYSDTASQILHSAQAATQGVVATLGSHRGPHARAVVSSALVVTVAPAGGDRPMEADIKGQGQPAAAPATAATTTDEEMGAIAAGTKAD
jgi:hypothetical protein